MTAVCSNALNDPVALPFTVLENAVSKLSMCLSASRSETPFYRSSSRSNNWMCNMRKVQSHSSKSIVIVIATSKDVCEKNHRNTTSIDITSHSCCCVGNTVEIFQKLNFPTSNSSEITNEMKSCRIRKRWYLEMNFSHMSLTESTATFNTNIIVH